MKLSVHDTSDAMAQAAAETAARILRDAITQKGHAAFIAATGASQFGFLKYLVTAPGIAWERTTMFHLDEYIGFSADHPASFRRYLRERLISKVSIGTVHLIEGDAPYLEQELARLNHLLAATPIDVAFVGIGENGHLAFNDPPADFQIEAVRSGQIAGTDQRSDLRDRRTLQSLTSMRVHAMLVRLPDEDTRRRA